MLVSRVDKCVQGWWRNAAWRIWIERRASAPFPGRHRGTGLKAATKGSGSLGRQYQVGTRFLWHKRRTVLIRGFMDLRNRWLFATAVGPKTKTLQAQRGLAGLLNLDLFTTVSGKEVSQFLPGGWSDFVHKLSAWAISKVCMTQAVKAYVIGEGWDKSKEHWARTGRRQSNSLTGENVIESIEIKVCS